MTDPRVNIDVTANTEKATSTLQKFSTFLKTGFGAAADSTKSSLSSIEAAIGKLGKASDSAEKAADKQSKAIQKALSDEAKSREKFAIDHEKEIAKQIAEEEKLAAKQEKVMERVASAQQKAFMGYSGLYEFLKSRFRVTVEDVILSINGMVKSIESIAKAGIESQAATNKLVDAMKNNGTYTKELAKEYENYSKEVQRNTKFTDEQASSVLQLGTSLTGLSGDKLKRATNAALDLSTSMGVDLDSAMKMISKGIEGSGGGLSKLIGKLDLTSDSSKNLDIITQKLSDKFGGSALEAGKTYEGQLTRIVNTFSDIKDKIGETALEGIFGNINTGEAVKNIERVGDAANNSFKILINFPAALFFSLANINSAVNTFINLIGISEQKHAALITHLLDSVKDSSKATQLVMGNLLNDLSELRAAMSPLAQMGAKFSTMMETVAVYTQKIVNFIPALGTIGTVLAKFSQVYFVLTSVYSVGMSILDFVKSFYSILMERHDKAVAHLALSIARIGQLGVSTIGGIAELGEKLFNTLGIGNSNMIRDFNLSYKKYVKELEKNIEILNTASRKQSAEEVQQVTKHNDNLSQLNATKFQRWLVEESQYRDVSLKEQIKYLSDVVTNEKLSDEDKKKLKYDLSKLEKQLAKESESAEKSKKTTHVQTTKELITETQEIIDAGEKIKKDAIELNEKSMLDIKKSYIQQAVYSAEAGFQLIIDTEIKARKKAEEAGSFLASLFGMDDAGKIQALAGKLGESIGGTVKTALDNIDPSGLLGTFGGDLVTMAIKAVFGGNGTYKSISDYAQIAFDTMVKNTNAAIDKIGKEQEVTQRKIDILKSAESGGATTVSAELAKSIGRPDLAGKSIKEAESLLIQDKIDAEQRKVGVGQKSIDDAMGVAANAKTDYSTYEQGYNAEQQKLKYATNIGGQFYLPDSNGISQVYKPKYSKTKLHELAANIATTQKNADDLQNSIQTGDYLDSVKNIQDLKNTKAVLDKPEATPSTIDDKISLAESIKSKNLTPTADQYKALGYPIGTPIGDIINGLKNQGITEANNDTSITDLERQKRILGYTNAYVPPPPTVPEVTLPEQPTPEEIYNYALSLYGKPLSDREANVFGKSKGYALTISDLSDMRNNAISGISGQNISDFDKSYKISNLKSIPSTIDTAGSGTGTESGKTPTATEMYNYALSLYGQKLTALEAKVFGKPEGYELTLNDLAVLKTAAITDIMNTGGISEFEKASNISSLRDMPSGASGQSGTSGDNRVINVIINGNAFNIDDTAVTINDALTKLGKQGRI